jgi:N-acetylglucosamine transport system permease protein
MRRTLVGIVLLAFALSIVLPLLWVIGSPWARPASPHWVNYSNAWKQAGIGLAFGNSLLVTLATLMILIPAGAMAAYVLARFPFPGSKFIFGTFLGGMMFPNFLVIVPLFMLLRTIHLFDTRIGLIVIYAAYSLSFTIFVLSGFFQVLPGELSEAAMMDGCTHAGTFWKVMLPLARPGILVVAVFNAIGLWNEYSLALVLIPSHVNQTLPLGLANLAVTQQYESDWGALFAGLVIVMTPVLAVYWVFRNRIHDTMLAGAVKG